MTLKPTTSEDIFTARDDIKQFITEQLTAGMLTVAVAQDAKLDAQLNPIRVALQTMREWKQHLWANGSGGPPGWLEVFAKQTNDKLDALTILLAVVREQNIVSQAERAGAAQVRSYGQQNWKLGLSICMFIIGGIMLLFTAGHAFTTYVETTLQSHQSAPLPVTTTTTTATHAP